MFFRVVVLGCGHSHLMSAFVVTMLYSCLPVLTGIVSVKGEWRLLALFKELLAAGFVFGKSSIPCLLDLVEQVNAQFSQPVAIVDSNARYKNSRCDLILLFCSFTLA